MRWVFPLGIAALAAALRWFRIDAQSLWYDEGISAHQLTRSFPDIVGAAALDTHPPLYYETLKAWAEQLDMDEAVELLEETLDEEKETDANLSELSGSINEEADDEGKDEPKKRKAS